MGQEIRKLRLPFFFCGPAVTMVALVECMGLQSYLYVKIFEHFLSESKINAFSPDYTNLLETRGKQFLFFAQKIQIFHRFEG